MSRERDQEIKGALGPGLGEVAIKLVKGKPHLFYRDNLPGRTLCGIFAPEAVLVKDWKDVSMGEVCCNCYLVYCKNENRERKESRS